MSGRFRTLIVVTLLAVIATPAATTQPVAGHLLTLNLDRAASEFQHGTVLLLVLLVIVSSMPLLGVIAALGRWIAVRKSVAATLARCELRSTREGIPYRVAPLPGVSFFTVGVVRPAIFASRAAVRDLSPEAFRAAILHEREHVRRHDPGWRLALALLEAALKPIPPIRRVVSALVLESEFLADQGAIAAGAAREHLFDAMVAAASPSPAHGIGLTNAGVAQRLEALARPSERPQAANAAPLAWVAFGLVAVPLAVHGLFWMGAVCL